MNLTTQVALVTGAAGGIGSALAQALESAGCRVIRHQRASFSAGEEHEVSNGSLESAWVFGDLNDVEAVRRIAREAEALGVTLLVNNAGVGEFSEFEASDIQRVISTNVIAPLLLTQALLPSLKARPEAAIVNIGSGFGHIGFPGFSTYSASKFALRGFSEALRRELSDTRVKVMDVSPGAIRTPMNDDRVEALNQAIKTSVNSPESVALAVVKALSTNASRSILGSTLRLQSRLNALVPRVVDGALASQWPLIKRFF